MVKVAENSVVALDVLPGNKQGEQLAQQTRYVVTTLHLFYFIIPSDPLTLPNQVFHTETQLQASFHPKKPKAHSRTPKLQQVRSEAQPVVL